MDYLDALTSRLTADQKKKTIVPYVSPSVHSLVQAERYLGEIVSLTYDRAKVQIQDGDRNKVQGVPSGCFLIATRMAPGQDMDFDDEDATAILLRVLDTVPLFNDGERDRINVENAQRVQGDTQIHWDNSIDDVRVKNLMSFGAVTCRVIGTFYGEQLKFGNDMDNVYAYRGMKVYKPNQKALESIVNFGVDRSKAVNLGKVRYTSTNRFPDNTPVIINPSDLIAQRTALFGMSRTGKSNTVKIIAKAIYQLRQTCNTRVGQLIFDVNGEYANDNLQDVNDVTGKAQSLKNVWQIPVNDIYGDQEDVRTYGLLANEKDPNRVIMKINFYDQTLMQIGKELLDEQLKNDATNGAQYIKSFLMVEFQNDPDMDQGERTREDRRRLVYQTLLFKAGFKAPKKKDSVAGFTTPPGRTLFSKELTNSLYLGVMGYSDLTEAKQREFAKEKQAYEQAAAILRRYQEEGATYDDLARAFQSLSHWINNSNSTYGEFDREYTSNKKAESGSWADVHLSSLLKMFEYENAVKKMGKANIYHDPHSSRKDYAEMIYDDLASGKLVIIDQALGDSELNKLAAERILRKIFEKNNKMFAEGISPSKILIFVEEAHNLMPKGSEEDTRNIWARVAKEGSKFNIGLIYSTQEVSSIQTNILKNTANWFIAHLNNKSEVRALADFYDFEDYARSILQAEDKGYIRMKTLSNKFVVPIQMDKFQIDA